MHQFNLSSETGVLPDQF